MRFFIVSLYKLSSLLCAQLSSNSSSKEEFDDRSGDESEQLESDEDEKEEFKPSNLEFLDF